MFSKDVVREGLEKNIVYICVWFFVGIEDRLVYRVCEFKIYSREIKWFVMIVNKLFKLGNLGKLKIIFRFCSDFSLVNN